MFVPKEKIPSKKVELQIKTTVAELKVQQEKQRHEEEMELSRAARQLEMKRMVDEQARRDLENEMRKSLSLDEREYGTLGMSSTRKKVRPSPLKELLSNRKITQAMPKMEKEDQKQVQKFFQDPSDAKDGKRRSETSTEIFPRYGQTTYEEVHK
jgi:hypothetical protein